MSRPLAFAGITSFLAACAAAPTDPTLVSVPAEVRAARTSVVLSGQTVAIDASLWRDFQPTSPAGGKPLIAIVRARPTDGSALTASVSADSVWVISGDHAWSARAVQERPRSATDTYLEVVARAGPTWDPGTRVDVVLRLHDATGRAMYVRIADQVIARTD